MEIPVISFGALLVSAFGAGIAAANWARNRRDEGDEKRATWLGRTVRIIYCAFCEKQTEHAGVWSFNAAFFAGGAGGVISAGSPREPNYWEMRVRV